jgi:hypothetical protein
VLDEEVVGVMADHYGLTRQAQAEQLLAWQYDTLTATYFLLLARRQAGKQFRILQPNPDLKPLPDLIADKVTYRYLFYFVRYRYIFGGFYCVFLLVSFFLFSLLLRPRMGFFTIFSQEKL